MDEEEENKEMERMERMDMRTWRCDDIKIEMDELENTVIVDQTNVKLKLEDCKMELTGIVFFAFIFCQGRNLAQLKKNKCLEKNNF